MKDVYKDSSLKNTGLGDPYNLEKKPVKNTDPLLIEIKNRVLDKLEDRTKTSPTEIKEQQ